MSTDSRASQHRAPDAHKFASAMPVDYQTLRFSYQRPPDFGQSPCAHYPVLVVGAGPVGLTAARLVVNAGRRCLVVERRNGPQRNPAAHVVNARTLEIFRHASFDMERIGAIAQNPDDAGHVNFVSRLNGTLIGRLPFERQGDEYLAITPHPLRNISQHRLEPLYEGHDLF